MAPTTLFKAIDKSKQSTSSVRNDMLEKVSDFSALGLFDELESILGTDVKMSRQSYNAGAEELKSTATDLDDLDVMQKVVKDADAKLFFCNDGKVASEDETLDDVGASKVGASSTTSSKTPSGDEPADDMDVDTNGSNINTIKSIDDLSSNGGAGKSKTPTKTNDADQDTELPRTADVNLKKSLPLESNKDTDNVPSSPILRDDFVPSLNNWVYNQDQNNIGGNVMGHHKYKDGKKVTTSKLHVGAVIQEGHVVKTISGSKYHLGNPEAAEEKASAAAGGGIKRGRGGGGDGDGTKPKKKKEATTNNDAQPQQAKPFVMPNGFADAISGCTNTAVLKEHIKKCITKDIASTMNDTHWKAIDKLVSKTMLRAAVRTAKRDLMEKYNIKFD